MSLYRLTICILLVSSALLNSCRNAITIDDKDLECTPYISNPRIEWHSLNDCQLDNGSYSSTFYVLVDRYGECITTSSPFTFSVKFYNSDGTEIEALSFNATYYTTKDLMELGVCLRFGDAQYAQTEVYCTTANGKKSNTLSFTLKRPKGAL